MMHSKGVILGAMIFLAAVVSSLSHAPAVSADMIIMTSLYEGSSIHNGTHVYMPEANVSIFIKNQGSIFTNLQAEFQLVTNTTQNVTLGFVLPRISSYTVNGPSNLTISANSTERYYTVMQWDDLVSSQGFSTECIDIYGTWLEQAEFAIFNLEMEADHTVVLTVVSDTEITPEYAHVFEYSYTIASARTFENDTHEVVHIEVLENEPFLNVTFSPQNYLTLSKEDIRSNARWEFDVSDFSTDTVSMWATIREYQPWGLGPRNLSWLIFPAVGIVVIITALAIKKWR
ncbi:MAG: hypothetical protein JW779_03290 [Candidatus Thorarchaeota archaeon]|nr:hypothetical protein [Candidatus Thorarchaeota archaeon]